MGRQSMTTLFPHWKENILKNAKDITESVSLHLDKRLEHTNPVVNNNNMQALLQQMEVFKTRSTR